MYRQPRVKFSNRHFQTVETDYKDNPLFRLTALFIFFFLLCSFLLIVVFLSLFISSCLSLFAFASSSIAVLAFGANFALVYIICRLFVHLRSHRGFPVPRSQLPPDVHPLLAPSSASSSRSSTPPQPPSSSPRPSPRPEPPFSPPGSPRAPLPPSSPPGPPRAPLYPPSPPGPPLSPPSPLGPPRAPLPPPSPPGPPPSPPSPPGPPRASHPPSSPSFSHPTSLPPTMPKTLAELTDKFLNGFEGCAIIEVVDSFRSKKPLDEMMSFLLGLPEAHRHLTPAECRWEAEKHAKAAEYYRAQGNAFYDQRLVAQALGRFSTSIVLAPHPPRRPYPAAGEKESFEGSETPFPPFSTEEEEDEGRQVLSLAYANRSAMLLELKRYSACLRDIGLALRFGYPKRLRYKLVSRWARCLIALDREREAVALLDAALEGLGSLPCDELTLANAKVSLLMVRRMCKKAGSSPKGSPSFSLAAPALAKEKEFKVPKLKNENRSAPALSSAVKVAYSRAKGRHLVATRDINPGELLCVEKSFATVLEREMGKCSHCLASLDGSIIPCPECTEAMFCSLECQQEALSSYHRVECPIAPNLASLGLPSHVLLAFRVIAKMSLKKLKKEEPQLRKEVETRKPATLGLNAEEKYMPSSYRAVYHLNTNQARRPDLDLFNACVVAFVLLKLLQRSGRFFCCKEGQPCTPSHEDLVLVGTALCSHVLRATCNGLTITDYENDLLLSGRVLHVEIGLGLFPTLSLANHSCDPTATVLTFQTGSLMMSSSFIQKGGEVTRSYGVSHLCMERKKRRALLQECYHFLCNCRACEDDWPLFNDISNSLTLICLKCSQPLCALSLQCRKCKIDYGKPLTKKEAKMSNRYFCMEIMHKIETARQEFMFAASTPVNFDENEKKIICDLLRLLAKYTKHPTKLAHVVRKSLDFWLMFWAPAKYFR